jgi:hypothetical protein
MRLLIETSTVQFRVAGLPKRKIVKGQEATTRDGRPVWTVRLDAVDAVHESKETIWVEVAGDEPRLTFDGYAVVRGLVFAPWLGRDGKIKRAFRADAIEPGPSGKSAQAA